MHHDIDRPSLAQVGVPSGSSRQRTAYLSVGLSVVLVLGYAVLVVGDTWRHPPEHPIGREHTRADQLWDSAQFGLAALAIALVVIGVCLLWAVETVHVFGRIGSGALAGGATGWAICVAASDWSGEGQNGLFWLTVTAAVWGIVNALIVCGVLVFHRARRAATPPG